MDFPNWCTLPLQTRVPLSIMCTVTARCHNVLTYTLLILITKTMTLFSSFCKPSGLSMVYNIGLSQKHLVTLLSWSLTWLQLTIGFMNLLHTHTHTHTVTISHAQHFIFFLYCRSKLILVLADDLLADFQDNKNDCTTE